MYGIEREKKCSKFVNTFSCLQTIQKNGQLSEKNQGKRKGNRERTRQGLDENP